MSDICIDYSDRAALAYTLHREGANCAQSVLCAFGDRITLPGETLMAVAGGFGGGVGGSHQEICGAASGGVMVLSLLLPFANSGDTAAKKRVYAVSKRFRQLFSEALGHTRCGDLLEARPCACEKTPAALRLGITAHCDVMIVTAVELVERLLKEESC